MKPLFAAAAILATLGLAGCGDAPKPPADAPAATAPAQTAPVTPAPVAPAEPAPAVTIEVPADTPLPGTDMTVQDAMQAVQQVQDLQMTDEQKQQAVSEARAQAEAAARAGNLSQEQVRQAGDAAENAAKAMFGLQ